MSRVMSAVAKTSSDATIVFQFDLPRIAARRTLVAKISDISRHGDPKPAAQGAKAGDIFSVHGNAKHNQNNMLWLVGDVGIEPTTR
jgi:hypothetical protein